MKITMTAIIEIQHARLYTHARHFYIEKQVTLRYIDIYKEPDTIRYILISKKTIHFSLRLYIYNLSCSPDT